MAKLRPLPYSYEALEPTLGRETVRIHHDTHQAGYVRGWNEAEQRLRGQERASGGMLRGAYDALVFNGAGVILHEMYWENLCGTGSSPQPSALLVDCAAHCFGSLQALVYQMASVGAAIRGSGWVVLAWVPRFRRMVILPVRNHQDGWIPGAIPLLVIDVWEHAYYLDYQAARQEYLRLIWNNVDWGVVSERHRTATGET